MSGMAAQGVAARAQRHAAQQDGVDEARRRSAPPPLKVKAATPRNSAGWNRLWSRCPGQQRLALALVMALAMAMAALPLL